MADTVEGLVIEIESNAGSAGSQLDALAAKLENLKRVVGSSTPLKTFSKNYAELMVSINSHGVDASKLEGLSAFTQFVNQLSNSKSSVRTFSKNYEMMVNSINALQVDASKASSMQSFVTAMSGVSNIKISSTITKQLDNLNFVIQNMNVESVSGLESMINALAKLSAVNGIKISTSITNQLERIAELAKNIQGYDFTKLSELTAAISQLGALSGISGENVSKLVTSVKQFSNATKSASSRGRTFNTVLANIRTRTLLLVRATQMIRRATTQALGVYGDYIETLNLFKMAMGSAGEEAYEFAEKAQSLLGIDLTQWMKAQGVFNALASGFGVAGDRAAIMSKNLTQLAYDISSFYNIDVDTAVEKVRSGFSGQIRPVRDLGYDLSQARLEAIALSMGIDKSVKSMTQAEKSQLRYIALMTQLTQVQGDLSRTLDSPINQMRILQAQLQQMYRSIGMTLLPILNKVLPYLNAILRVIKMIADEIAAMFGYTLPRISSGDWSSSVVMGAEDIEEELDNATGAAEKLKNTLASFDQINLISSSSGGSGSGAGATGGGGGFDFDLPEYDFLGDAAENKAQEIAEGMMRKLRPLVDFIKDTILWTSQHLDDIGQLLGTIALVTIGKHLIDNVRDAWKWFSELNTIVKGLGLVTIGLQLSYLGGKDLAKGDILKGIVESVLGSAALAYGGYLLFGPTGIVLGLGMSVALIFTGYQMQKEAEFREHIMELFHSFDEGKASLDQLTESWGKFTGKFENTEWLSKYTGEGRKEIEGVAISIGNLQLAYAQGLIGADYYVESLSTKFGELKETVLGYLDESRQAITDQLNGALGAFLLTLGYTQEEINDMLDASTENISNNLDDVSKSVEDARKKFEETGDIEEYQNAIDEASKAIEEYFGTTGLMSKSLKDFNESMDVFKDGISLDSLEDALSAIQQINTDYDAAIRSLHDERDRTVQYFETFVAGMPPEMQSRYEGLISSVKTYFSDQEEELKQGYRDTMGILESEATGRWEKIFDKEGLEGVKVYYDEFLKEFGSSIESSYKKRSIDSGDTVFGQIIDLMEKADEAGRKNYVMGGQTKLNEKYTEVENISKAFRAGLFDIDDYVGAIVRMEKAVPDAVSKTWKKTLNENSTGGKKFTEDGRLIVEGTFVQYAAMGDTLPPKLQQMYNKMNGISEQAKVSMQNTTRNTINSMVDMFSKNGQEMPEEMKRILAKTQDMIKPADFGLKGASVTKNFMDNFKKDFTPVQTVNDFKDTLSRMLDGDDAKEWGVRIGDSIKTGMTTGLSGAETGVTYALNGAKTVLDQFGSASASYWSQMSKNIATVTSAIVANPTNPALKSTLSLILSGMKWTMKGFAKGGFPDSADFFYANENGVPEYIGTMGGRTAVANNTEIAKGIADAVVKAIRDTGIASDVKKIASKDGKIVFAPSEEAGRVMAQSVNMYNSTGGRY